MELSENEMKAIAKVFCNECERTGEDLIGVLILNGVFRYLKTEMGELVALADKIEQSGGSDMFDRGCAKKK